MGKNILVTSLFIVALLSGCVESTIPSGWPPAANSVASPIITSISPADSATGGVLNIAINGSNFGTSIDQCSVYFGIEPGIITSITSNQIVTLRPITYGANISTRVVIQLADDVAQKNYTIKRVVTPLAVFPAASTAASNTAIASDTSGNVYVAFINVRDTTGAYKVIRKISLSGTLSDYATYPPSLSISYLRVGSNGTLYAMVGSSGDLYSVGPGGGSLTKLFSFSENVSCFDIDQNRYFYAGSLSGSTINIVQSTTVVKGPSYADFTIRALRVFQNYVFVLAEAGTSDTIHIGGVFRHQILGGTLGPQESILPWNLRAIMQLQK